MFFHWSLSDSKSPLVSRTLLSIMAVFNNLLVWIVSSRPLISKSSNPFNNPLMTTKSTKHNWYNCHFHVQQFFQFPSKVEVLILLFIFLQFYLAVSRDSKIHNFPNSLFFVDYYLFIYIFLLEWSLSDSSSPQFSKSLLYILADFNSAVVWIVSILSLIFCSHYIILFAWIWVTSSLLRSPEVFDVSYPILTVLWSRWPWFTLNYPAHSISFPGLCGPFWELQIWLT